MDRIHVDGSGWSGISCRYCVYFLDRGAVDNLITNILYEEHTNNEMEYLALIRSLREVNEPHHIFTDSQLIFGQVNLNWRVNLPHLIPLRNEARSLLLQKGCVLTWIPREQNEAGKIIEKQLFKLKNYKNKCISPIIQKRHYDPSKYRAS